MPLARPRKGRRDELDVSESLDELLVPFLLARFALGGYGGSVLWNKSLGQNALTKPPNPLPELRAK